MPVDVTRNINVVPGKLYQVFNIPKGIQRPNLRACWLEFEHVKPTILLPEQGTIVLAVQKKDGSTVVLYEEKLYLVQNMFLVPLENQNYQ